EAAPEPVQAGGAEEAEDTAPPPDLAVLVAQTVAGLQQSSAGPVTASTLKRTLLRKDPTFSEADHGFRAFGELLEKLQTRSIIELVPGPAKGDPEIRLPEVGDRAEAFALLRQVVAETEAAEGRVSLSGLKDQLRRSQPGFSEKKQGYRSFLQFCKAAQADGVIELDWDQAGREYLLRAP
ncbi:MAG: OST-HTH/LOTUS domain-containing protein, partial [Ornithinimicrobium sp.]